MCRVTQRGFGCVVINPELLLNTLPRAKTFKIRYRYGISLILLFGMTMKKNSLAGISQSAISIDPQWSWWYY